jgi:DNA (cytosine-5)-methyltransferase 1
MKKLRALDLFCCAGGATKGLQRAGFHVTGVDIKPQPRYCGDAFIQGNALAPPVDLRSFDFIWASPPCQRFSVLRHLQQNQHGPKEYPNLIPQTRAMLAAAGVPFTIENVENAPLGDSGNLILLCGSMFGLQTLDGAAELRRHRLFETSFSIPLRPQCQHGVTQSLSVTGTGLDSNRERYMSRRCISVVGNGAPRVWDAEKAGQSVISIHGDHARDRRRAISITGSTPQTNTVRNRDRRTFSIEDARAAMGIDWMTMKGLSQAIPPAYSEFIAREFLRTHER